MEESRGLAVALIDVGDVERSGTRTVRKMWHGDGPSDNDLCVVIVTDATRGLWEVVCPGLPFATVRRYAVEDLLPRKSGWNRLLDGKTRSGFETDRLEKLTEDLRRLRTVVGGEAPLVVYGSTESFGMKAMKDMLQSIEVKDIRLFTTPFAAADAAETVVTATKAAASSAPVKTTRSSSAPAQNGRMGWLRCNVVVLSLVGDLSLLFWIWMFLACRTDLPWHVGAPNALQPLVDALKSPVSMLPVAAGALTMLLMLWLPRRFTFHMSDGGPIGLVLGLLSLAACNVAYAGMVMFSGRCEYVLSPEKWVCSGDSLDWWWPFIQWLMAFFSPLMAFFGLLWTDWSEERSHFWGTMAARAYSPWYAIAGACCLSGIVPVAVGDGVAKLMSWNVSLPEQAYQGDFPEAWVTMLFSGQGLLGIGIIILVTIMAAAVGRRSEPWWEWAAIIAFYSLEVAPYLL